MFYITQSLAQKILHSFPWFWTGFPGPQSVNFNSSFAPKPQCAELSDLAPTLPVVRSDVYGHRVREWAQEPYEHNPSTQPCVDTSTARFVCLHSDKRGFSEANSRLAHFKPTEISE